MPVPSTPKNANNAIEAALFVVVLAQLPDPATQARIHQALDTMANELPGMQLPPQSGFFFQMGNPGVGPSPAALARFSAAPNGTHSWRVELTGNVLQVVCQSFDDFGATWARAGGYLRSVLSVMDPATPLQEVGYQVIDKFEYAPGMTASEYSMEELFRRDSIYLTDKSWSSGLQWHVFQGWFDECPWDGRILNQLNVSNANTMTQQTVAIIDHRVALRGNQEGIHTVEYLLAKNEEQRQYLDVLFDHFHKENLSMVRGLLTADKRRAIGMDVA